MSVLFNILLILAALVWIGFCVKELTGFGNQSAILPYVTNNVWGAMIAFGIFVCLLAIFGVVALTCGALKETEEKEKQRCCQCGCMLVVYNVIVWILLLVELILAVYCMVQLSLIETSLGSKYATIGSAKIDSTITTWAAKYPADWAVVENFFGCCGYDSTYSTLVTDLCNPALVTVPWTTSCKQTVLEYVKQHVQIAGGVALAVVFLTFMTGVAGICIGCCMAKTKPSSGGEGVALSNLGASDLELQIKDHDKRIRALESQR